MRDLDPVVRKRLAEVVQLVQSYRRLAEFEISAGERPRAGEVALPEDTEQRVRQWVEGEEKRSHEKDKLSEELGEVMRVHAHDPTPIQEAMGG